jgi:hypothetical protein
MWKPEGTPSLGAHKYMNTFAKVLCFILLAACGDGRLSPQGGTITGVTAGNGLTGTTTSGVASLNVVGATGGGLSVLGDSVGLSTACGSTQVLAWDGDSWECADSGNDPVAGTNIDVSGSTVSVEPTVSLAGAADEDTLDINNTAGNQTATVKGVDVAMTGEWLNSGGPYTTYGVYVSNTPGTAGVDEPTSQINTYGIYTSATSGGGPGSVSWALWAQGNATVTGNFTASGTTLSLGDASTDALTVGATCTHTAPVTVQDFRGTAISPGVLGTDQNNYNPTGLATATHVRVDASTSGIDITGLAGGTAGRHLTLIHSGTTNSIALHHQSGSSSAGNRFASPTGANFTLAPGYSVQLVYDGVDAVWRILQPASSSSLSGGSTNALARWTSASTLGNSGITDDGAANATVTVGDASSDTMTVNSTATFANDATVSGNLAANGSNNTIGNDNADLVTVNGAIIFNHAHKRRLEIHEELFDCHANTAGGRVVYGFSGASAAVLQNAAELNHPAVCLLASGSTTTGRASAVIGGIGNYDSIRLGGGEFNWEALVKIDTLCDGTEDCVMRCGLLDDVTATPNDGVYFEYDRAITTDWRVVTASGGVRTAQTTSPAQAVAAGSWFLLQAIINAAGTSVTFYYNGTAVGTIATTSPTNTAFGCTLNKRAGTTAKYMYVDYLHATQGFTTQR